MLGVKMLGENVAWKSRLALGSDAHASLGLQSKEAQHMEPLADPQMHPPGFPASPRATHGLAMCMCLLTSHGVLGHAGPVSSGTPT
jgi:hypothetical protein